MNKKTFIKIIALLREQYRVEIEFANACDSILDGNFVPKLSSSLMNAFTEAYSAATSEAQLDWIEWWLYECNGIDGDLNHNWFVKENTGDAIETDTKVLCAFIDKKKYAPRNSNELWELLQILERDK